MWNQTPQISEGVDSESIGIYAYCINTAEQVAQVKLITYTATRDPSGLHSLGVRARWLEFFQFLCEANYPQLLILCYHRRLRLLVTKLIL
jgi:hypothetical protein